VRILDLHQQIPFADSIDHLVTDLALGAKLGFHKGHILLRLGIELRIYNQTIDENPQMISDDVGLCIDFLPLQFFTDLVSYLVDDVLHVLSALERPNAVDEASVLKL
jgi:hypothetical protein